MFSNADTSLTVETINHGKPAWGCVIFTVVYGYDALEKWTGRSISAWF